MTRFLAIGIVVLALEFAVFHSKIYSLVIEPDSSTGLMELHLKNEIGRPTPDRKQVLAVGHSRMGFTPRIANEMTQETGYTFGSIALGGTSPRTWYYELRAVDPTARRYAAVLIPVDDYDEWDRYDYLDDRVSDLHYVIERLGLRDLPEFSLSYGSHTLQAEMALQILFKSYVYRSDFQEFAINPRARIRKVRFYRRYLGGWYYGYNGEDFSLTGLSVDWQKRTIRFPAGLTEGQRNFIQGTLFEQYPPNAGRMTSYFRKWYGKIVEHYRGSGTKLIFLRVPRGPVPPPNRGPENPLSAVRSLASLPDVTLVDEHFFDSLETPELFGDPLHLNGRGMAQFSRMTAAETARILRSSH